MLKRSNLFTYSNEDSTLLAWPSHTNVCSYDKMRYAFVCKKSVNGTGNASFEYFSNLCPHALSLKVAYVRVFSLLRTAAVAACFTVVVAVTLGFLLVFCPQLLEMCVRLCFVFYIRYLWLILPRYNGHTLSHYICILWIVSLPPLVVEWEMVEKNTVKWKYLLHAHYYQLSNYM